MVPTRLDREGFLAAHLTVLQGVADGRPLWFPTFNYDFLSTGRYSIKDDPSQVGSINEYARKAGTEWRTRTPVFNFAGTGDPPSRASRLPGVVEPFDRNSPFGELIERDGSVIWYGAPFSSSTVLHHAEAIASGPLYRFDKDFAGEVLDEQSASVVLRYHVRPRDRPFDYDWDRIFSDAREAGIVRPEGDSGTIHWAPARDLIGYWVERQSVDPLYLLDKLSRSWIEPELERLGRRFLRSDFEEPQ